MTPHGELAARWFEVASTVVGVISLVALPLLLASLVRVARDALSAPRERAAVLALFIGVTLAKVLLWPPQNLVLIDEWESLSAVRELAAGRPFLNCHVDIPGVARDCVPIVYVPLFHTWAASIVRLTELPARSAGALLNALATSAVLPLAWVIVRRARADLPVGVVGTIALLAASLPAILTYSRTSTTDPLFVALTLAGAAALTGAATDPRRRRLHAAGLGAAFVLGCYARPEGFALGLMWAAGTTAAFAITSRRLPRTTPGYAAVAAIAVVAAMPAHLHGVAANVHSPGALAWLGSLVGFILSFLVPLLAPHVFPVWLSIGAWRSARRVSERHRAFGLALLFAFAATALIYSITFEAFEPPVPERTLAKQEYHLGVPSLLALAAVVTALPVGGRLRRMKTIVAVCIALNIMGTVALTATHAHSTKVRKAAAFSRVAGELEPDAVVFAYFSPMVRALSGHDHAELDALPSIDWQRLGDRPLYAFDSAPESSGREASSMLTEAASTSGVTLEPTAHPLLWRVIPPSAGAHLHDGP